jgi:hypothetical protein
MTMSGRLLTPTTHGPAQPVLKKMNKKRSFETINLSNMSWWKPRGTCPGSQKNSKIKMQ